MKNAVDQTNNNSMAGILIVVHGSYGEGLIAGASHILGNTPAQCITLPINTHDNMQILLPTLKASINAVDTGHGVLIMTDMYGATPSNEIKQFLISDKVEAIAGASLPMLISALANRKLPLKQMAQKAVSGGREGTVIFDQNGCDHYQK
jgi:PTS system ascorbate-specific IIA component